MSDPDFIELGRRLFAGPCDFVWAASKSDGLPPANLPEIAFAGRSNVVKSSLLNALTRAGAFLDWSQVISGFGVGAAAVNVLR